MKTIYLTIVALFVLVVGYGVITYFGRPVMLLNNDDGQKEITEQDTNSGINNDQQTEGTSEDNDDDDDSVTVSDSNPGPETTGGGYTLADVAIHNTASSCWSAVDDSVYDLTNWISRHPGGQSAIINLCGTDATTSFNNVHGGSSAAKAALVLLKIGDLAQ